MGQFADLLKTDQVVILDGALGTELEYLGYDISGKLWSAKYLLEKPEVIRDLHLTYLEAGADLLTTSTYQATLPGLMAHGLTEVEAQDIIRLTVSLAQEARGIFWQALDIAEQESRSYPLIGGDIGPYAAYLADGSEYTGDYGRVTVEELKTFHRDRIHLLLAAGVDFLILETLPNALEIRALLDLLAEEFVDSEAYLSLATPDGSHLPDGTPLETVSDWVNHSKQVLAVGLNCSSPKAIDQGVGKLATWTAKPLVTYPNSGEIYDGATQTWTASPDNSQTLLEHSQQWISQGARIVGGCCRTRPSDIKALATLKTKPLS